MSRKIGQISSKMSHFLTEIQNLPEMNQKFSYIFYTFFKNLPEMKEKSPWFLFQTHHMYVSFVKYIESETYSDDFPIPGHCYGNSYLFSQEDQMTDFALFPAQGYDTFFMPIKYWNRKPTLA